MISQDDETTPTPSVSLAILAYNKGRASGLADGIVITPSHNPPDNGGYKYNAANGGPADVAITDWIQNRANQFLEDNLKEVRRWPHQQELSATTNTPPTLIGAYCDRRPRKP